MLRRMFALMALVSLLSLAACGSDVTGVQEVNETRINTSMDHPNEDLVAPAPKDTHDVVDPGDGGGGGDPGSAPTNNDSRTRDNDDMAPVDEDLGL